MLIKLLFKSIKIIEKFSSKYFLSVIKREKYSDYINANPDVGSFNHKVSIVMQGPIIEKQEFTLETIKLYRKRYPNVKLILSTWDNYDKSLISKFTEIGVEVILNSMPDYFGISNVNLQVKSTKTGIFRAKELGSEYCLKTRTDQRIYKYDFILFFMSILSTFKLEHKHLKGRLITMSMNTFKYRLYGITDMLMFGNINDMILYWDVKFDNRKINEIDLGVSALDYSKARICEVYFSTEFFKKIKVKTNFTIKNYWELMANLFFVVDALSIDVFWFKYNRWDERKRYQNVNRRLNEEFMFSDWINSYNELIQYNDSEEQKLFKLNMK